MSQCLSMRYGHSSCQIRCLPLTILLMAIFILKRGWLKDKILPYAVSYICQVHRRCTVCLRADSGNTPCGSICEIPFWHTTSSIWTESNEFPGIIWWMTGLQNCTNETTEIHDPTPKNRRKKNILYRFLFIVGHILLEVAGIRIFFILFLMLLYYPILRLGM